MPKTLEEMEKLFNETQEKVDLMRKDFDIKIEAAGREVQQYKTLAQDSQSELKRKESEFAEREKKRSEAAAKARETEIREFAEGKVKAGIILPAIKGKVEALMMSLTADKAVAEFTEADGKKISHTQISLFKEIVSAMKPVIQLGKEVSFAGSTEPERIEGGQEQNQFVEVIKGGSKQKLPMADMDLHLKAMEYQEKNKGKSYEEALIAISPKHGAVV